MTAVLVDPLAGLECPPLHYRVPERAATYGPEVADFGAAAGLHLDPEQQLVVDATYAVDAEDRLVSPVIGCAAPRQNVKTHVAKVCGLADLAVFRVPECMWTAQQKDTARDAFRNKYGTGLADLFDNYDHLRRMVYSITDSDNETSIVLRPKRAGDPKPSLTFSTRTERGKVGFSGPRVTFDEAPWLKPVHTAAMIPILSAQSMTGWVQVRYFGSPGHVHSATWRDVRNRGRRGELAWIEWGAPRVECGEPDCAHVPGTDGCALDREDLVRAANLAVGRRIDIKFVMVTERNELSNPDPMKYARERLGWWEDPPEGDGGDVFGGAWLGLADPGAERGRRVAFGLAVPPDRKWAAVAVAWRRPDGHVQVMLADYHAGTDWVAARCAKLTSDWGGKVTASTAARGLVARAVEPSAGDQALAHTGLDDLVRAGKVRHGNQPALNVAVRAAEWRSYGDSRVLDRKGSTDISPIDAAALAVHALTAHRPGRFASF